MELVHLPIMENVDMGTFGVSLFASFLVSIVSVCLFLALNACIRQYQHTRKPVNVVLSGSLAQSKRSPRRRTPRSMITSPRNRPLNRYIAGGLQTPQSSSDKIQHFWPIPSAVPALQPQPVYLHEHLAKREGQLNIAIVPTNHEHDANGAEGDSHIGAGSNIRCQGQDDHSQGRQNCSYMTDGWNRGHHQDKGGSHIEEGASPFNSVVQISFPQEEQTTHTTQTQNDVTICGSTFVTRGTRNTPTVRRLSPDNNPPPPTPGRKPLWTLPPQLHHDTAVQTELSTVQTSQPELYKEVLRQWTTTLDRFYSRAKGDALSRLKSSGSYLKDSGQSAPMISTRRTRRLIRRLLADANGDVERFLDKLHRSAGTPRKLRSYRGHQCEEAGVESLIGEFSHLPSLEILRAILTRAHFHNDEVSQIIQTYLHSRQQQHQKRTQGDKATLENCNTSQDEPSLEEEVEFTEQSYGVFHQQHRVHGTPSHPIHGTHIQHPVGPKPSVFLHFDTRYPTQQLHHNWYPPPPVSPKAPSPTLKDTDDARLLETTSSC